MDTEKKRRGRPRKQKFFENSGMSYEGAINYALDKEVQSELDDTLAHKDEDELTDDERKYLKRKKEKKSYTLNVRFTESEMQDILAKLNDLQAMSTKLKEKYNALVPEHNAFVTKRDTAHKYTRQVRNYLQNKEQQERNRQYQEKKRTQQRKKDTLE